MGSRRQILFTKTKIDAKYINANCSCILPKFKFNKSLKNHRNVSTYIYYRQDDDILAISHQIESRVAIQNWYHSHFDTQFTVLWLAALSQSRCLLGYTVVY